MRCKGVQKCKTSHRSNCNKRRNVMVLHRIFFGIIFIFMEHGILGMQELPLDVKPICDVSIDTALCLHNDEYVLLPDSRPYGTIVRIDLHFERIQSSNLSLSLVGIEIMQQVKRWQVIIQHGISSENEQTMCDSSNLQQRDSVDLEVPHFFVTTIFWYPIQTASAPEILGIFLKTLLSKLTSISSMQQLSKFSFTFFIYLLEDEKSRANALKYDQFCPIIHKGFMRKDIEMASPAILINPRDGRVKVVLSTTAFTTSVGEEIQSNSKLRAHLWYHIGGMTMTNELPLYIGGTPYSENSCDLPLLLDEFRFYSRGIGRDQIQAEASAVLSGIEPAFIHIGCTGCNKLEAETSCPDDYHLCDKKELFIGGYQIARKLNLGQDILAAGVPLPSKGIALCCMDF
ncbi:membrane protein [Cardiosporidium cionae]|uniref:Membrane protein n=1 Tax=Cardiosporidium cionae TaxID=476202 RepID=A0ABQ7JA63_9APIC|nr:membrane protein [Cardiosporidium cionae]|eukprot:KAF8820892.1 membrane protein [Cardiosporidium cionae]